MNPIALMLIEEQFVKAGWTMHNIENPPCFIKETKYRSLIAYIGQHGHCDNRIRIYEIHPTMTRVQHRRLYPDEEREMLKNLGLNWDDYDDTQR